METRTAWRRPRLPPNARSEERYTLARLNVQTASKRMARTTIHQLRVSSSPAAWRISGRLAIPIRIKSPREITTNPRRSQLAGGEAGGSAVTSSGPPTGVGAGCDSR